MIKKILLLCLICLGTGLTLSAQKLNKFGADLGKKSVMGQDIRVPYFDLTTYFGYVKLDAVPDETRDSKKFYYLYLWIPVAAPEIGVRMISPVPEGMKPGENDFVSPVYLENATDNTSYFDTWISLERAVEVFKIEDIMQGKTAHWVTYDSNDDSGELPAQPSGSKYNSLMRVTSEISNPLRALVVGLYRIGFTTYKTGEVKGGFLAQIGAPIKMKGVAVATNLEDLMKKATEAAK
jgi:hypothetical protein